MVEGQVAQNEQGEHLASEPPEPSLKRLGPAQLGEAETRPPVDVTGCDSGHQAPTGPEPPERENEERKVSDPLEQK